MTTHPSFWFVFEHKCVIGAGAYCTSRLQHMRGGMGGSCVDHSADHLRVLGLQRIGMQPETYMYWWVGGCCHLIGAKQLGWIHQVHVLFPIPRFFAWLLLMCRDITAKDFWPLRCCHDTLQHPSTSSFFYPLLFGSPGVVEIDVRKESILVEQDCTSSIMCLVETIRELLFHVEVLGPIENAESPSFGQPIRHVVLQVVPLARRRVNSAGCIAERCAHVFDMNSVTRQEGSAGYMRVSQVPRFWSTPERTVVFTHAENPSRMAETSSSYQDEMSSSVFSNTNRLR